MRCRSSAIAALIAATDFSRPTPSGTTSLGKTTASRSGTTGRSFGYAPSGVVVFVSSVILVLCFLSRFGYRAPDLRSLSERRGRVHHSARPRGLSSYCYYFEFAFVAL